MSDYPGYTSPNAPQEARGDVPAPHATPPPAGGQQKKPRNTIGTIALVTAVIGFIFACIPGALIVGWVLLPIAFVLSIVGLAQSGKPKGTSIAAIILSIVGFIVGVLVFMFAVGTAIDDAFAGEEAEIIAPADEDATEDDAAEDDAPTGEADSGAPEGDEGTRATPVPIGSTISAADWDVTITSFEADATDAVLRANEFNDEPGEGNVYALVEVEATYTGDESEHPWLEISLAYVTEGGNTVESYDSMAVAPDPQFSDIGELYEGASGTGYQVFEIPDGDDGLLRVTPGFMANEVFVATK